MHSSARDAFAVDVDKFYSSRMEGRRTRSTRLRLLFSSEMRCVACYRFAQATREVQGRRPVLGIFPMFLSRLWNYWTATVGHAEISREAEIGPGFFLVHRIGTFIGDCRIGSNSVIHQNVVIGIGAREGDVSVPEIGDNVWIGPHAIITGGVKVGNGVTISAGTVVSRSVPDNCLVVGNPGRVVSQDYDNSALIGYVIPDSIIK